MSHLLPVYPRLPITVVGARGAWLTTDDGRRLLDLYGGHAVTCLGHGHPALRAAIADCFERLDFFSNSVVLPEQEAAALAVLGDSAHLRWAHFVNSGTEANEAALHLARRRTGRQVVVSFDCGFHGRTLASLAATGLAGYQARLSLPLAPWHRTIPFGAPDALEAIDGDVAAVLCESVPSLAGVYMPPDGYYAALQARCREVGAVFVMDEVQGGVGRLGAWFAHERFGVQPDLVTLAKSVGGGLPVGVLLGTAALGEVGAGEIGTTFGGGPMACAAVRAVAAEVRPLLGRVEVIFAAVKDGLAGLPGVEVRGAGCLIGVQTPVPARELNARLLARDVIAGTSAEPHTLRLLPPYTLTDDELGRGVAALRAAITA